MREIVRLNNGWKFAEQFEEGMHTPGYSEQNMTEVRLPHTVKELPLHYFDERSYQMITGYRKTFEVKEEWRGKRILLTIDGAAHDAQVYVNGEKVTTTYISGTQLSVKADAINEGDIVVVQQMGSSNTVFRVSNEYTFTSTPSTEDGLSTEVNSTETELTEVEE